MCDKVFLSSPPSKGGPFPLRNGIIGIGRYVDFLCVYFGEQHTTSEQPHCGEGILFEDNYERQSGFSSVGRLFELV